MRLAAESTRTKGSFKVARCAIQISTSNGTMVNRSLLRQAKCIAAHPSLQCFWQFWQYAVLLRPTSPKRMSMTLSFQRSL